MNWNCNGARRMSDSLRPQRRFQLVLIKPSHYDDDGYVIQWFRSVMPSNSLAALYGLAIDAAERQVLGPDVSIDVTPVDETNTRIKPNKIIARLKRHGGFGLVGLVGVQSNQFPRAMDIARPLRAAGVPVVIGGFHISGCLSMLAEMQPDIQEALDLGISLFAGEAEERLDTLLRDAASEYPPADLQLSQRPPVDPVGAGAVPAAQARQAHGGQLLDLRCRPRLPVPMLVLHHHQRARTEISTALA